MAITDIANKISLNSSLVANVALATVGKIGVAGYMFVVKNAFETQSQTESTDHYVQSGYFIQDHIAFPPDEITLRGQVSETEFRRSAFISTATKVVKVVGLINSFLPVLTNTTKSLYKTIKVQKQTQSASSILSASYTQTFNIYSAVQSILSSVSNQGQVYSFFKAIRDSRTIVSVITPWAFYPSVIITRVSTMSPQESNSWCNMEIKFKEWREQPATSNVLNIWLPENSSLGVKNAMASVKNNGIAKGVANNRSLLSNITNRVG